jgi:hypothetical protein
MLTLEWRLRCSRWRCCLSVLAVAARLPPARHRPQGHAHQRLMNAISEALGIGGVLLVKLFGRSGDEVRASARARARATAATGIVGRQLG